MKMKRSLLFIKVMISISKYKLRFRIEHLQKSNIFNQDDIQQLHLNLLISRDIVIYTGAILTNNTMMIHLSYEIVWSLKRLR